MDNLFVPADSGAETEGASGAQAGPIDIGTTEGTYRVLANGAYRTLTPAEVVEATQLGLNYQQLTDKWGTEKQQLMEEAGAIGNLQQELAKNPEGVLAALAKEHGLTVGRIGSDNMLNIAEAAEGFSIDGLTSKSNASPSGATSELEARLAQMEEQLKAQRGQSELQAAAGQLMSQGATAEEVTAAAQFAAQNGLGPQQLSVALMAIRGQAGSGQQQQQQGATQQQQQSGPEMDPATVAALMKMLNPALSGTVAGASSDGHQVQVLPEHLKAGSRSGIESAYAEAKRQLGVK